MKNDPITDYLTTIGARGGRSTARRGAAYYRDLQRRSVIARRRNTARAGAGQRRSGDGEGE